VGSFVGRVQGHPTVEETMLIIAGWLRVAPPDRDTFVANHQDLIRRARQAPGCLDLDISPDPVDPGRVNNFERWESEEHLNAWRAVANAPAPFTEVLDGDMQKYEVSSSGPPF
jgi:quinol monooxygenase YgiN